MSMPSRLKGTAPVSTERRTLGGPGALVRRSQLGPFGSVEGISQRATLFANGR